MLVFGRKIIILPFRRDLSGDLDDVVSASASAADVIPGMDNVPAAGQGRN